MAIVKTTPNCPGPHDWKALSKEKTENIRSPSQMFKVVCVTNGASFLSLWIVRQLLLRGYTVRLTVHTTEELQKLGEMEEFVLYPGSNRLSGVVANVVTDSIATLCEAFNGCYGVFHTSSFIDPHGVSGYTENTVDLEVKGAENVVEACSLTSSVGRCVFTSSLAACVWLRHGFSTSCDFVVDENCWSDQQLCREKKVRFVIKFIFPSGFRLWLPLAKTLSEKAAWRVAEERGGAHLVTVCPAFITGPAFAFAFSAPSSIAYLKGAREMYEKSLLATVDVRSVAEAHVCVYEEMEMGASGRYICLGKLITGAEDATDLETQLNMRLGFSAEELSTMRDEHRSYRILNAKLARLMGTVPLTRGTKNG